MTDYYICAGCENLCEKVETYSEQKLEFWGAPITKRDYEWVSDCCGEDCYTPEEWRENNWDPPTFFTLADLIEHGFLDQPDGQPDEAQEWHDFDPDC
jgi:hypothetical protein